LGYWVHFWGLGPIPNPQSPIPNPQSPIPKSKNCTNDHNTVREEGLSNLYCTNNIMNTTYGYWDLDIIKYFSIDVVLCDINHNPNCKTLDEIENYITNNSIYIQFSFPTTRINGNSKSGISQDMKFKSYLISDKIVNYKEFFFTENIMKTSGGLFFNAYETKVISIQSEVNESQTFKDNNFRNGRIITNKQDNFRFAFFLFFFDKEYIEYERKIIGIEDVINQLGGITQILIIIIQIINSNYSDELFLIRLESFKTIKSNSKKSTDELSDLKFLDNNSKDKHHFSKSFDSNINSKNIICKISSRLDLNFDSNSNLSSNIETYSNKIVEKSFFKKKHLKEQEKNQEIENSNIKIDSKKVMNIRIDKKKLFLKNLISDDLDKNEIIEKKLAEYVNSKPEEYYLNEFEYFKFKLAKFLRFITCKKFVSANYEIYKYLIKKNTSKLSIQNYFQLLN
jgi:hypothetical protein